MSKASMIMVLISLLLSTVWSQLIVKNTTGDMMMQVDSDANVTIGSAIHPGALITHTITILDGAANSRVLKSDASGLASWDTDEVNDADHTIGNEYQNLNEVLTEGHSAGNLDADDFRRIGVGISNHYGLHVSADKHYLNGNLLVEGKVGINIGDRESQPGWKFSANPISVPPMTASC
ncbi:hypothetical protein GF407_03770 [candidate division KSB1 bacterium]|nr:hypothetical protein [candidate division KSB1 bacterium]